MTFRGAHDAETVGTASPHTVVCVTAVAPGPVA